MKTSAVIVELELKEAKENSVFQFDVQVEQVQTEPVKQEG